MSNNETRALATFLIWVASAAIVILSDPAPYNEVLVIGLTMLAAMLSTAAVWHKANLESGERRPLPATDQRMEKSKRSDPNRIARLADVLDDDEAAVLLDELRARFNTSEDGELVSLEKLLEEREARRRS